MARVEKDIAIADKQTLDSVKEDTDYIRKGLFGGSDTSSDSSESADNPLTALKQTTDDIKDSLSSMLSDLKSDLSSIAANVMLCSKNRRIGKQYMINKTYIQVSELTTGNIVPWTSVIDKYIFNDTEPIHVSIFSNVRENESTERDDALGILYYRYYNGETYVKDTIYVREAYVSSKYFEIPGAYDEEHPTYVELALHGNTPMSTESYVQSLPTSLQSIIKKFLDDLGYTLSSKTFLPPITEANAEQETYKHVTSPIILWQYETVKLTESDISTPATPDDSDKTTAIVSTGLAGIVGTLDLVEENSFTKTI